MKGEGWAHVAEGVALLGQGDERLRGTGVRRTGAEECQASLEVAGTV